MSHVGDVITHGKVMSVITFLFISIHFILHSHVQGHTCNYMQVLIVRVKIVWTSHTCEGFPINDV